MSDDKMRQALEDMFAPEKRPLDALKHVAVALALLRHQIMVLSVGEKPSDEDMLRIGEHIDKIIAATKR